MLARLADGGEIASVRLKLGSVLVREHGGVLHQVMVVQGGFAWNDRVLPSLSAAALAITGTKWNGNRLPVATSRKQYLALAWSRKSDRASPRPSSNRR